MSFKQSVSLNFNSIMLINKNANKVEILRAIIATSRGNINIISKNMLIHKNVNENNILKNRIC